MTPATYLLCEAEDYYPNVTNVVRVTFSEAEASAWLREYAAMEGVSRKVLQVCGAHVRVMDEDVGEVADERGWTVYGPPSVAWWRRRGYVVRGFPR